MRGNCEAIVVRAEILGALEASGPDIELMSPDIVRLKPWRGGLRVLTAAMQADLKAVGRWDRTIEAPCALVRGIVAKSTGVTLVLVYAANKLAIGRTIIDAREEASAVRFFQPGIGQQAELMEVRADLRHLLSRPLKARRHQASLAGLPLFSAPQPRN